MMFGAEPWQGEVYIGELPPVPEGYEITRVDVVVRLKPKKR